MSAKRDPKRGVFGTSRGALVRNLVLLVLTSSALMLGGTLYAASRLLEETTRVVVARAGDQAEEALDHFFEDVEMELRVALEMARSRELSRDPERFNALLIPILEAHPTVTSVLYADQSGEEILLLRDGDTWRNRISAPEDGDVGVRWMRWSSSRELLEDETVLLDYDSRTRPWYQQAAEGEAEAVLWTDPYTFHTTRDPGITVSTRLERSDGFDILAFDVMLLDVSEFTTSEAPVEGALTLVLTDDGRVLGLPQDPRFNERGGRRDFVLQPLEDLELPLAELAESEVGHNTDEASRIRFEGRRWWAASEIYELGGNHPLKVLVIVPETTLLEHTAGGRNFIIAANLLVLALAVLVALGMERSFRRRVEREVKHAKRVGRYRLLSRLGGGGMGDVYLARHDMIQRDTAVKVLRADRMKQEDMRRFEREVRYTCELTHPNTITVYDFGRARDGVFYYAMEYLHGMSLQDIVVRYGPLPPERAIYLIEQVCRSLAEAHAAGLIHRDLKPANIFAARIGGQWDFAKVLDFGLVKRVRTEARSSSSVSDGVVGTPAYLAPEAVETPASVTHLSDVYALGATLWQLVVGKPPFVAESVISLLMKQVSERPRSLRAFSASDVSSEFEQVVRDCLAKSADDRPPGVEALAERLRECPEWGRWDAKQAEQWWMDHPVEATQEGPSESELHVSLGAQRNDANA